MKRILFEAEKEPKEEPVPWYEYWLDWRFWNEFAAESRKEHTDENFFQTAPDFQSVG